MQEKENIRIIPSGISDDCEIHTHPAFGIIRVTRSSGGNPILFGSSINNNEKIAIEITRAEGRRNLSRDWYHSKGQPIVRIEMSYAQFAECITSINRGEGTPCTITRTETEGRIPTIAENIDKRKQFRDEFANNIDKAMNEAQSQIAKIKQSLTDKKNFTVRDKKELINALGKIHAAIGCNLNFVLDQFDNQMEKSTQEAKHEIEAFYQTRTEQYLPTFENQKLQKTQMSGVCQKSKSNLQ